MGCRKGQTHMDFMFPALKYVRKIKQGCCRLCFADKRVLMVKIQRDWKGMSGWWFEWKRVGLDWWKTEEIYGKSKVAENITAGQNKRRRKRRKRKEKVVLGVSNPYPWTLGNPYQGLGRREEAPNCGSHKLRNFFIPSLI